MPITVVIQLVVLATVSYRETKIPQLVTKSPCHTTVCLERILQRHLERLNVIGTHMSSPLSVSHILSERGIRLVNERLTSSAVERHPAL